MPDEKSVKEKLVDSALLIAILTAVCYAIGYLADVKMYRKAGIPSQLVSDAPVEYLLTTGGMYVMLYVALALLGYGLFLWASRKWPAHTARFSTELADRTRRCPQFYYPLFGLAAVVLVSAATLHIPARSTLLREDNLPHVVALDTTTGDDVASSDGWKFVSRRDGFMLFKDTRDDTFALFREETVNRLVVRHDAPMPPESPAVD
jgi:hypothetical protein